jgi:hypothetical protein
VQCCGLKLAIEDLVADRPTWTASKKNVLQRSMDVIG